MSSENEKLILELIKQARNGSKQVSVVLDAIENLCKPKLAQLWETFLEKKFAAVEDVCPICQEAVKNHEDHVTFPCCQKHMHLTPCAAQYKNPTCPFCRQPFVHEK